MGGKSNALFTSLILPHVFGEGSRPFYNSAVATFCHQLANGESPRIIEDRQLELLHVQRLAEHICADPRVYGWRDPAARSAHAGFGASFHTSEDGGPKQ